MARLLRRLLPIALVFSSRLLEGDCPAAWNARATAGPSGRYAFAMSYEGSAGRAVLFGGTDDAQLNLGDTWGWDGAAWSLLSTSGPEPRKTPAMVYDESRARLVLFGGSIFSGGQNRYFPETWEWNGTQWEIRAASGPSGRCCSAMAYDSARHRVVLFGGDVNGAAQGDTWEWDGAAWTRMTVAGPQPAARHSHAMVYDHVRGRVVLFGGMTGAGFDAETWEWDGALWSRRNVAGPSARVRAGFVGDPVSGAPFLAGGEGASGYADTTVWRLDSAGWRAVEDAGFSRRSGLGLTYDARRDRLVAFGGSTSGANAVDTWERVQLGDVRLLAPIALDVFSGTAHFTTELALSNRGSRAVDLSFDYAAALGSREGSGSVADRLEAGEQRVVGDVLSYLRGKGLAIPSAAAGQQGGTLRVGLACAEGADLVAATARTTSETASPLPAGNAGLAYQGLSPGEGSAAPLVVDGLRVSSTDRSNLAIFSASSSAVTLRVTAFSGDRDGRRVTLADAFELPPWQWAQFSFGSTGLTNGWVVVERVAGVGLFGSYGVVNDNVTNDGSFLFPAGAAANDASTLVVPVLVETSRFVSELVLTNRGDADEILRLGYLESLGPRGTAAPVELTLAPGEQRIIPEAIDFLRGRGAGIGARGASYAGALRVELAGPPPHRVSVGARTASQAPGGGQFGLFTPGIGLAGSASTRALLYGLRSDARNRSNVALVSTGGASDGPIDLRLQAYDGKAGGAAAGAPRTLRLEPGAWTQLDNFLGTQGVESGWVEITRASGAAPWLAYGVVNDGGNPGERTGDGAYVPMRLPSPPPAPAPRLLSVGGSYGVAVALLDNTCGSVTVQTQPTSVAHEIGASTFTLTHLLTYSGQVGSDGRFTTAPLVLSDSGSTTTLTIDGRFTTAGFDATVAVNVQRAGGPCVYHVAWTAVKQGAPNALP